MTFRMNLANEREAFFAVNEFVFSCFLFVGHFINTERVRNEIFVLFC